MSDGGLLPNARLPRPRDADDLQRRSASARKAARVRSGLKAKRDGKWGPEGPMRGSAPVGRIGSIAEILDRLNGRST